MTVRHTWTVIRGVEALTALLGEPTEAARHKARTSLSDVDVSWLRSSPFCAIAQASRSGGCDASPKGDPAGHLVPLVDERTIAPAERPGNRRADGYHHILEHAYVGLLLLIPGRGNTLRINGRGRLVSDAPFFDQMVVRGRRPALAVVVEIEELFHHCSKAFLRSTLCHPSTWEPEAKVPRRAVLAQQLERSENTVAELDEYYDPSHAESIYCTPGA